MQKKARCVDCNPSTGRWRQKDHWGLLTNPNHVISKFHVLTRGPVKQSGQLLRNNTKVNLWPPQKHVCLYTSLHTHQHKNRTKDGGCHSGRGHKSLQRIIWKKLKNKLSEKNNRYLNGWTRVFAQVSCSDKRWRSLKFLPQALVLGTTSQRSHSSSQASLRCTACTPASRRSHSSRQASTLHSLHPTQLSLYTSPIWIQHPRPI